MALLHESSLTRTMPTGRILTCRCDMHWSAEGGHPIEDLTAEDDLTHLPSWTPASALARMSARSFVRKVSILEQAPTCLTISTLSDNVPSRL